MKLLLKRWPLFATVGLFLLFVGLTQGAAAAAWWVAGLLALVLLLAGGWFALVGPQTLANRKALLLLERGELEGAARLFTRLAARKDGFSAVMLYNLAWVRVRQGRAEEGLPLLEAAQRMAPGNAMLARHALANRAIALALRGRLEEARDMLAEAERAAEGAPEPLQPHFARIAVALAEGRRADAAAAAADLERLSASARDRHPSRVARLVGAYAKGEAPAGWAPNYPDEFEYLAPLPGFGEFLKSSGLAAAEMQRASP